MVWQECWGISDTRRHLYSIQNCVGRREAEGIDYTITTIITHLRIEHTPYDQKKRINVCFNTFHGKGEHPPGLCSHCNQPETIKHVLFECKRYNKENKDLLTNVERKT